MRIYVAGPMTGIPELNFPAFHAAAAALRAEGHHVENPAEINADPTAQWLDCMRMDIARLVTCDAVYMLPGWQNSRGALVEHTLATGLGLQVMHAAASPEAVVACAIIHSDGQPAARDNHGCLLPEGHDGPHEFVAEDGRHWLWETDLSCNCAHCARCEGDYCTEYWLKCATAGAQLNGGAA